MDKIKLHELLIKLQKELNKGSNEDKGVLERLASRCLFKANIITNTTKDLRLKYDYRNVLNRLNQKYRKCDSKYEDINKWARIVLNSLLEAFPRHL